MEVGGEGQDTRFLIIRCEKAVERKTERREGMGKYQSGYRERELLIKRAKMNWSTG